jgi:hypothetical protein
MTEITIKDVRLTLNKIVHGGSRRGWDKQGSVSIDFASIESIEDFFDRNSYGVDYQVGSKIVTKTGHEHLVHETPKQIERRWKAAVLAPCES